MPPGQPSQERRAGLNWPDFSQGIAPTLRLWEATDRVYALSDAFVDAHIRLSDPKERPLFLGLGRWRALRDLGRMREEWRHLADTAQARDRWVDEWQDPKALLDPTAKLSQSATKTVGLLRMLDAYAGEGVVDRSIESFVVYGGGPLRFEDFYVELLRQAGRERPLPDWSGFSSWLTQVGLPILESRIDGRKLGVQQSGFTLYPDEDLHNRENRWPLPLVIRFRDAEGIKTQRALLLPGQGEVTLECVGAVRWADVNGSGMGWFRTHVPDQERLALLKDLPRLGLAEQTNFQIDQWRLVRHGSEPIGKFYESLLATKIHDSEWLDLLIYEMGTQQNWPYPDDRPAFNRFLADLARSAVAESGMRFDSKDDPALTYQKAVFRHWLALDGDSQAQQAAQDVVDHYHRTGEVVRGLETAASPELLEELSAKTREGFRQGKVPPEAYALIYWPTPEGSQAVGQLLGEPESRLSEKDRAGVWKFMSYSTPSLDTLWQALSGLEHPEQVAASLATGPYRSRLAEMPAPLREKILTLGGSARTLVKVPDQIHDFLVQRGYLLTLARRPLSEKLGLLGDTLNVSMPEGSEVEARGHNVMAAPESDEAETRVVLESGPEKLVLMSQQLYALGGTDLGKEVDLVLKDRASGTPAKYLVSPPTVTDSGLKCVFVREEGAEEGKEDANLIDSMFIQNVDGTVQHLAVYLNPTACKEWTQLAPIARSILQSVGAGSKRANVAERTVEADPTLGLSVKVPAGMMVSVQDSSDFRVVQGHLLRELGAPSGGLLFYFGSHPNFEPKPDEPRIPGRLLGQEVEWRRSESRMEALVSVPGRREQVVHVILFSGDEQLLEGLRRVAETLHVSNPNAPAYEPMEKGDSLRREGKYREALAEYEKFLVAHPGDSLALYLKARCYAELKDYPRAIAICSQLLTKNPDDDRALYLRSRAYFHSGQYRRALDDCNRSLQSSQEYGQQYEYRGDAQQKLGNYREAVADYTSALRLGNSGGTGSGLLAKRAKCLRLLGRYREAVADCSKALQDDEEVAFYEERARSYVLMKRGDLADKDRLAARRLREQESRR